MKVYVVDMWDEEDLMDSCVDRVFLKKENAESYIKREEKLLEQERIELAEDGGFDGVPHYRYRITTRSIEELK